MSTDVAYDGKVWVMKRQCATCIFNPEGTRLELKPGRRDELVAQAIAKDGQIPCHSTLHLDQGAVCRGFFTRHATSLLQIAERLGYIEDFEL